MSRIRTQVRAENPYLAPRTSQRIKQDSPEGRVPLDCFESIFRLLAARSRAAGMPFLSLSAVRWIFYLCSLSLLSRLFLFTSPARMSAYSSYLRLRLACLQVHFLSSFGVGWLWTWLRVTWFISLRIVISSSSLISITMLSVPTHLRWVINLFSVYLWDFHADFVFVYSRISFFSFCLNFFLIILISSVLWFWILLGLICRIHLFQILSGFFPNNALCGVISIVSWYDSLKIVSLSSIQLYLPWIVFVFW